MVELIHNSVHNSVDHRIFVIILGALFETSDGRIIFPFEVLTSRHRSILSVLQLAFLLLCSRMVRLTGSVFTKSGLVDRMLSCSGL